MDDYSENLWYREKDFTPLSLNEEKCVAELRLALHRRDFEGAKKTLRENFLKK